MSFYTPEKIYFHSISVGQHGNYLKCHAICDHIAIRINLNKALAEIHKARIDNVDDPIETSVVKYDCTK